MNTRLSTIAGRLIVLTLVVGVMIGLGCSLVGSSHKAPPLIPTAKLVDTESGLIPVYREGPARFDSLFDYFRDANPELFEHLADIQAKYAAGDEHRGVTYIAGSSGVGKSYVIRKLDLPKEATTKPIKLAALFDIPMPDLASLDGQVVFNRLPGAETVDLAALFQAQGATDKAFVLLDDLDEIHPDTARLLLKGLDAYLQNTEVRFLHVLVFGRPEAFSPWLQDAERRAPPHVSVTVLLLFGPDYQTTGDVAFRCQDYHAFRKSASALQSFIAKVKNRLEDSPYLRYTIRPLSAGNLVLDEYLDGEEFVSDIARRHALLMALLERNTKSHGRPGASDGLYLQLLKDAAAYPLLQGRTPDAEGFFTVKPEATIDFWDAQSQPHRVYVADVLDRSGLIVQDLKKNGASRYRFEPFWIHMVLVEGRNQRSHRE